jgi:hypothetical protein
VAQITRAAQQAALSHHLPAISKGRVSKDLIAQAIAIAPRELTCREQMQYLNESLTCP